MANGTTGCRLEISTPNRNCSSYCFSLPKWREAAQERRAHWSVRCEPEYGAVYGPDYGALGCPEGNSLRSEYGVYAEYSVWCGYSLNRK